IDRAWMWQRCTEFGSFPTTDGGINSMFDSLVSLSFETRTGTFATGRPIMENISSSACSIAGKLREFDAEHIEKSIRSTIEHYGGADGYKGTNVVIANGGRDPWSLLSKLTSEDPSVVSYVPSSTPESFESGFFEQPVDHFDNQNPYTFNQ
ncbi:hypothetical protein TELCIR_14691, partial [Teladorsagia circumcincta]